MLKAGLRPVGRRPQTGWIAVAVLLLICAPAGGTEGGGNSLEIKNETFWDRNRVWNLTPAFLLKLAMTTKWTVSWNQELDVVSGASRRLGLANVGRSGDQGADAVSGASKVEVRHSENVGATYSKDGLMASASFYHSREDDYLSLSPALSLARDFNQRNTTVGVVYAEFFDEFHPLGAFAEQGGKKRIRSMSASLTQSITSLTLVNLTGSLIRSRGYLGHPYTPPIDVGGTLRTEVLPAEKQAGALSGQVIQGYHTMGLLGSANLEVRRYQDDWGMKSTTADLKLNQYVAEGTYVRVRLRFYNQTGTLFAKEFYQGDEAFRSADVRWYPFSSWLGGVKVSSEFPEGWEESALLPDRWDIKYDHLMRDTRGDSQGGAAEGSRRRLYQLYESDEYYLQGLLSFGLLFNL